MNIDPTKGAQFTSMQAAADFLGNGAIQVNMYENEIFDMVRRSSPVMERMPSMPSNGHPHRYFEQTAIGQGQATDPRSISYTPTNPTRVERFAPIKGMVNGSNFGLFDVQVTKQQGQFAYLEARDIEDIINGIQVVRCRNIWQGADTSFSSPTSIEYFGLLNQITRQKTIANGASIIDGLKEEVAAMVARTDFVVKPSAIYINPVIGDLIDREAKAAAITLQSVVVGGVTVSAIQTQAGLLPLIGEPFLPSLNTSGFGFSAPAGGLRNYFAAILTENVIERPYIDGGQRNGGIPQLFKLGLVGDLQNKYVAVVFDAVIAKGASYAHSVVAIQRP